MGIQHENADCGAEADQFREVIEDSGFNFKKTKDEINSGVTTVEYINGEGDPPFVKYRWTLEPIELLSPEEFEAAEALEKETDDGQASSGDD